MKNHWLKKTGMPSSTDMEATATAFLAADEDTELRHILDQQLRGQLWAIARIIMHRKTGWGNMAWESEMIGRAMHSVKQWKPETGRLSNIVTTIMLNVYYQLRAASRSTPC